ncbi:MATE family efflux transporter [Roseivirga sp. BDSF3-8]|uniref:MATE family efflux transporter n=1 Tax=Roseivirga sp. BDSF3-8 TaxID=3241598 RepID=UPI0035318D20
MTTNEHIRKTLTLAGPVMLGQLGHVMVGVADSIMVGQLGTIPLAAASLANGVFIIILTIGLGFSFALTPLAAAADGKKNVMRKAAILKNGLLLNGLAAIFLALLLGAGVLLLDNLRQPPLVVEACRPYLLLIGASILPLMVYQVYKQFVEGLSHTRQAMYISISANLLNVVLNYLLIFGKLGFPPLGLVGAGVATVISRLLMGGGMAMYYYLSSRYRHIRSYNEVVRIKKAHLSAIWRQGWPTALQFLFEVGAFSMATIMMGWISAKAQAAHQIAISLASITYMAASGISASATIRVGNQLGASDFSSLRKAGFIAILIGGLFMALFCTFFIVFNDFLPTLYIDEIGVIEIAASLLVVAGFFQISDGVQVVTLGALRGMGDVKVPTIITFVAYWLIALPVGYLMGFHTTLGSSGVWFGLLTGLSVAAVLLLLRFHLESRRQKRKIKAARQPLLFD